MLPQKLSQIFLFHLCEGSRRWLLSLKLPDRDRLQQFFPVEVGEASDDAELFELAQQTLVAFDRRAISTILRRGIKRGELRRDTNVAIATDILHGTLIYRTLLVDRSLAGVPPSYFRRLVDALLAGIGSRR